jgi:hypothetical protein
VGTSPGLANLVDKHVDYSSETRKCKNNSMYSSFYLMIHLEQVDKYYWYD